MALLAAIVANDIAAVHAALAVAMTSVEQQAVEVLMKK
jgi:hypothetical protein